jgi:putative cell wall-binding protein
MDLSSPSRSALSLGSAALVLLVGASLLPSVASSASAEEIVPALICPQEAAVVGFPFTPRLFVQSTTPSGAVEIAITGAVPDGLHLTTATEQPYLFGMPTKIQSSTFMVTAKITRAGSSETVSTVCTVTVEGAPTVTRIAGADRYDQSVKVSKATFLTTAPIVFLASGEKFADALSASAIAAEHGAPLLLAAAGAAPAGVLDEIARLRPADIVIVGGVNSVSAAVVDQVEAKLPTATVTRIDGADRYAVSRNLISHENFGVEESTDVYLATGANFPDALSASPAAAVAGAPVLLVNGAEVALTAEEKTVLDDIGVDNAFIVGGPNSVSTALQTDIEKSFTTVRYGGVDRLAVSGAVNEASFTDAASVYLSSAAVFPDALSGGVAAGMAEAPLYITRQSCISDEAAFAIGRLAPESVVILGGTVTLAAGIDKLVVCPTE